MSSGDFDKDIYEEDLGAFLDYKSERLFKIYGAYIFSATGETKISDRNQNLENGTGFKFGVGVTILPLLDVNLDYRKVRFNKDIAPRFDDAVNLPIDLFI
ncbi:MAG: hypothetical protein NDI69_10905 [Bacteriovoracaceae bacterium]|nr:hypothetical protein [Bacteriovoracaceae bacterium]